jgi:hypothetical protein
MWIKYPNKFNKNAAATEVEKWEKYKIYLGLK